MNRLYFNTNVETACQMTNLTDEEILSFSKGDVTKGTPYDDESETGYDESKRSESLIDPEIFGNDRKSLRMGHITLPVKIVNINYLYGSVPILPKLLKMERRDVERIVYYASFVVTESNEPELPEGTFLKLKDLNNVKDDTVVSCGADAIEYLLKKNGIEAGGMIHSILPVVPFGLRFFYCEPEKRYIGMSLNILYDKVLTECRRIQRLTELQAPAIILLNEKRMLQEQVDSLIDNGAARGRVQTGITGKPDDSLYEAYHYIASPGKTLKVSASDYFSEVDMKNASESCTAYRSAQDVLEQFTSENVIDGNGEGETDDITDRYRKLCDNAEQIFSDLYMLFSGSIDEIIKERFPEYAGDFSDALRYAAKDALRTAAYHYSDQNGQKAAEDGTGLNFLTEGIIPMMELYAKKKIPFETYCEDEEEAS